MLASSVTLGKLLNCSGPLLNSKTGVLLSEQGCGLQESILAQCADTEPFSPCLPLDVTEHGGMGGPLKSLHLGAHRTWGLIVSCHSLSLRMSKTLICFHMWKIELIGPTSQGLHETCIRWKKKKKEPGNRRAFTIAGFLSSGSELEGACKRGSISQGRQRENYPGGASEVGYFMSALWTKKLGFALSRGGSPTKSGPPTPRIVSLSKVQSALPRP